MTKRGQSPDFSELLETLRSRMDERGYTFQFVLGSDETPPYIYTIGLSKNYGHPEIYMAGLPPEHAMPLIGAIIEKIAAGERFDFPRYIEDVIHVDMPIRPMTDDAVREHAGTGWEILGGPYKAVQLFYPDKNGYAPWEPECAESYARQEFFELEGEPPIRQRPIARDHDKTNRPAGGRPTPGEIAERRNAITQQMRDLVDNNGFTFQPVMGGEDSPSFMYSIGLSKTFDHPEIFVVGLNPGQAHELLLDVVAEISGGKRFDKPCLVQGILEADLAVRPIVSADVSENSGIGQEVLGRRFEGVQLYYPDESGLLPWEAGCDKGYAQDQLALLRPVGVPPERIPPSMRGTIH